MPAEWTVLVYIAADPDLVSQVQTDLKQIAKAPDSPAVQVLVQVDVPAKPTVRYRIHQNQLEALQSFPNVNSIDPAVVRSFIDWGLENYPATKTAFSVWSHGAGWDSCRAEDPVRRARTPRRPFAKSDFHPDKPGSNYLSDPDLRDAVKKSSAGRINVLGRDACLMGMIEIAYELREMADYYVASELNIPRGGWPYEAILAALVANPKLSPLELVRKTVKSFGERYAVGPHAQLNTTLSAIDLRLVAGLVHSIDGVAIELQRLLKTKRTALVNAQAIMVKMSDPEYVDLRSCLERLGQAFPDDQPLNKTISQAKKNLTAAVRKNSMAAGSPLGGWSIYFPRETDTYRSGYQEMAFGRDCHWSNFLQEFMGQS